MPTREEVIAALVAETGAALGRNGWAKNSCLPATRIRIDILNSYGEALGWINTCVGEMP
jgi:hypothetical protein